MVIYVLKMISFISYFLSLLWQEEEASGILNAAAKVDVGI